MKRDGSRLRTKVARSAGWAGTLGLSLQATFAYAHTNTVGFILTSNPSAPSCVAGAGASCYNVEVFYGSWHASFLTAEGDLAVFQKNADGTETQVIGQTAMGGTQTPFTISPLFDTSGNTDYNTAASLPSQFVGGQNYFWTDGTQALVADPALAGDDTWSHQSATAVALGEGTYRIDYDQATKFGLTATWQAIPGVGAATFTIGAGGNLAVGGVTGGPQDITDANSNQTDLGGALNYAFDGGVLNASRDETAGFTISVNSGTVDTQGNSVVFSGDQTGVGKLTKTGAGTLTFTGDSTAAGGVTVDGGTFDTTGGGRIADTAPVTIGADGTFAANTADTVGAVTNAGVLTVNRDMSVASLDASGTTNVNAALTSAAAIANAGTMRTRAPVTTGGRFTNTGTLAPTGAMTLSTTGLEGNGTLDLDAGSLTLDQSGGSAFTGSATGAGGVTKTGAGTLQLQGANSFAGGLTVAAGAVDTTGGGTLSDTGAVSIASGAQFVAGTDDTVGAVTNAGTMRTNSALSVARFDNTGSATVAGRLTIGSALTNNGSLDLSGSIATDTLENAKRIDVTGQGTITLDRLTGTGDIAIGTANLLTLEQSGNSAYQGAITGEGALRKSGAGTLRLAGDSALGSGVTVAQGGLDLNGRLAARDIEVAEGALLKGTGEARANILVRGDLEPGNSPGTLTVNGDVTMTQTGVLRTEIDGRVYDAAGGAGTYDRLALTGPMATFTADGRLAPVLRGIAGANNDLTPVVGDVFRVVTTQDNASGIAGRFASFDAQPDGTATGTRFSVIYGGDYIDLAIIPGDFGLFASALGRNAANAGAAFDRIRGQQMDASDYLNGFNSLTEGQLALAILQSSGEIHAFALDNVRESAREMTNGLLWGLDTMEPGRNVWVHARGFNSDRDADAIASGYDGDSRQIWAGADLTRTPEMRAGVALGYAHSTVDTVYSGSAKTDLGMLAGYFAMKSGRVGLSGDLGVGFGTLNTSRTVSLSTGRFYNEADGDVTMAFLDLKTSYDTFVTARLKGAVWGSLSAQQTRADAYRESGDGITALSVGKKTSFNSMLSVGYTVTGRFKANNRDATWQVGLGARRGFGDGRVARRNLSIHDADWSVSAPDSDATSGFLTAGLGFDLGNQSHLALRAEAGRSSNWKSHGLAVQFDKRW